MTKKEENKKRLMELYENYLDAAEKWQKASSSYCDKIKVEVINEVRKKRKNEKEK